MTGARTLGAEDLVPAGLAEPGRLEEIRRVAEEFAVAVTEDMAALIDPADPADPIAAQFVPSAAELDRPRPRNAPTRSATSAGRRSPASSTAIPTGCC